MNDRLALSILSGHAMNHAQVLLVGLEVGDGDFLGLEVCRSVQLDPLAVEKEDIAKVAGLLLIDGGICHAVSFRALRFVRVFILVYGSRSNG